jgi:hypothetical protein
MIGIRIRVLQFNGDEAGALETFVYLAIKFNRSRRGGFPSWAAEASSSSRAAQGGLRRLMKTARFGTIGEAPERQGIFFI